MRVWIDLSNSPHPLLFAPIARRLEEDGHEILISVRDNAQTVELALERWPSAVIIGTPSPKSRPQKALTLAERIRRLQRLVRRDRPDVAVSHNSYAQIVAARLMRVPVVTAMDFEHQPANHLAFRLAQLILLPEALKRHSLRSQGATAAKTRYYPGLKEEICLGDFEPDVEVLSRLGLEQAVGRPLVVLRTPPSRAVYHRFGNPLFEEALEAVGRDAGARCVVLTRHPEQRQAVESLRLPHCHLPSAAIDSRSLMFLADVVVGAGGTMTREAALLGVPTFSVFAGEEPAVDSWLREQGSLSKLTSVDQLFPLRCRTAETNSRLTALRAQSQTLVQLFAEAIEATGDASRFG